MKENQLRAIVFDFDGVVVDTEPLHHQAFLDVLKPYDLRWTWDEYVQIFIGYDDRAALAEAFRRANRELTPSVLHQLIKDKAERFITLAGAGVEHYPGLLDLIHDLRKRFPLALCSGALRSDIVPILEQLELTDVFKVMTTADDVERSKPDPTCYRLTVERLARGIVPGLKPSECLAIEDTPAGIQSAQGAGIPVWAVPHTHEKDALQAADRVMDCLADIGTALSHA